MFLSASFFFSFAVESERDAFFAFIPNSFTLNIKSPFSFEESTYLFFVFKNAVQDFRIVAVYYDAID